LTRKTASMSETTIVKTLNRDLIFKHIFGQIHPRFDRKRV
jgi:hypothetical protein